MGARVTATVCVTADGVALAGAEAALAGAGVPGVAMEPGVAVEAVEVEEEEEPGVEETDVATVMENRPATSGVPDAGGGILLLTTTSVEPAVVDIVDVDS